VRLAPASAIVAWLPAILVALSLTTARDAAAKGRNIEVSLVSEQAAVSPGRPFHVGVRMKIRDGWHTYWRNPGDSGLAPRIAWALPDGFEAGPIEWPVPERHAEGDLVTYGYSHEVTLPIRITPPQTIGTDSVMIAGTIDWLECKDVCMPGTAVLRLALPVSASPTGPGPGTSMIAAARSRLPAAPAGWSFSAEAGPRAIAIAFVPPAGVSSRSAYFFADQPLVTEHAAPQGFERTGAGYRVTMSPAANASGNLERLTGVLVVEGGGFLAPLKSGFLARRKAVQVDVPVRTGDPSPAPVPPERAGFPAAAYAVAAGIAGLALALFVLRKPRKQSNHT
jgi:DsbC/DsbD-like thiol-disulfide interchange protein